MLERFSTMMLHVQFATKYSPKGAFFT